MTFERWLQSYFEEDRAEVSPATMVHLVACWKAARASMKAEALDAIVTSETADWVRTNVREAVEAIEP